MEFNKIYTQLLARAKKNIMVNLPEISGLQAYYFTKMNNQIRLRYSGSKGNIQALKQIQNILIAQKIPYYLDTFINNTPIGKIRFNNLIVDIKGKSDQYIIVGCHHDTKLLPQYPQFSGANDGSSGVGLLLNLILHFYHNINYELPIGIKFIFFDGQQSIYSYTNNDGLHGSKHAAKKYSKLCKYMILLDMIGYKELSIQFPPNSNSKLIAITNQIINNNSYQNYFQNQMGQNKIIDDTTPFQKYGIPTINFIQMSYPYWHKNEDTFDKISMDSLKIIGNVVIKLITALQNK